MAAQTSEQEQRRRRRKRILRGLVMGGAAVGLPALANLLIARRVKPPEPPVWGRQQRYAWSQGEVAFQRLGDGPPVVLVHSLHPGASGEDWRQAAELLADSRQVFVPDLLGWGASEKPAIAYDGELYIQLLVDFLTDVVRDKAVVVAAGLAGAYAVQVGVDRNELLAGVGLVVPHGIEFHGDEPDLKDAVLNRLLNAPVLGTSALNLLTSRAALARMLKRELYASPERVDAGLVERHYRNAHQPGVRRPLAASLAGYLNHRVQEALPRLRLPTWLAWGRRAAHPPLETADLWLRDLSGARLEVFEEAGALPHAEAPARFVRRLERFLRECQA